jgi:hypothetical protein
MKKFLLLFCLSLGSILQTQAQDSHYAQVSGYGIHNLTSGVVKMPSNISSVSLKFFDANGTELGSEKVIKIRN